MVHVRLSHLSVFLLSILWVALPAHAQDYNFNLYLNLGPLNIPAGSAHLYDTPVLFEGKEAIRTAMEMCTNPSADRVFSLRDTIESYNTPQGESLYFSKTVHEGHKHNLETAVYSNEQGRFVVNMTTRNLVTGEQTGHATEWRDSRIFDLMSMIAFTQKIDTSDSEPGQTESLPMVNGIMVVQQFLVYTGNKTIKADDGKKYDCMIISIRDYKEGKERETVKAYVTNDKYHKPVQLDINLGVGTTIKALLK